MQLMSGLDETVGVHNFPATTEEVIEEYGDLEIELPNGDEQLEDVLGRLGSETFESPDEVKQAALCGVSNNAIGRKGYSDRDPSCIGEDGHDQISF